MKRNQIRLDFTGNLEPLHGALKLIPELKPKIRKDKQAPKTFLKNLEQSYKRQESDGTPFGVRKTEDIIVLAEVHPEPFEVAAYVLEIDGDTVIATVHAGIDRSLRQKMHDAAKTAQRFVDDHGMRVGYRIRRPG